MIVTLTSTLQNIPTIDRLTSIHPDGGAAASLQVSSNCSTCAGKAVIKGGKNVFILTLHNNFVVCSQLCEYNT